MSIHDILKQRIETDLLEHYIKYITMVQDWEGIRVFEIKELKAAKEVTLDYCYTRVKDGDEKGRWGKCLRKGEECKTQCGIDITFQEGRSILKNDTLKDKLINNQEKHIVCSEMNLGNMHKALQEDIFTERYIPALDEYDKSRCENKVVLYEYPPYTIFPDNEYKNHTLGLYYERQQIEILRQLAMKRKVIMETTRHGSIAAMTAIVARNLSHNIGSHVLSRWIVALNELLPKCENLKDIKERNYSVKIQKLGGQEAFLEFLSEVNERLESSKPLFQYIQHRMDFIATVATSVPSSEMTMDFKEDVLSPFTDKEWNEVIRNKVILENIAASEGFDDISFKENLPENCRRVSIPNGMIGTHAIYSILENFIRNAAKHYKGNAKTEKLPIGIELKIPDRVKLNGELKNGENIPDDKKVVFKDKVLTIKKDKNGQTYMLTKEEQVEIKKWFSSKKDKEALKRFFYIHERYIKLKIWDMRKGSCSAETLEDVRKFIDRKGKEGRLIGDDGAINPDGWGIKEMIVSSNFLRKNSPEKLIGDLEEKEPSIMEIMCDDESNDIACKDGGKNCHRNGKYKGRLGIRLYLRRPKDLWIIGDNGVIIEKDKFEIEYSNIVKENKDNRLTEDIPHRLLFVAESKKKHYEDDPMAPMRIMTYNENVNNGKAVDDKFYLDRYEEFIKELGGYKKSGKLPLVYYGGGKGKELFKDADDCLKGKYLSNKASFQPCGYAENDNKSLPFFYYHANEGDKNTVTKLIKYKKYFQPISGKYTSVLNKLETLPKDKQYQRHFLLELIESFLTKVLIIDERVSDLADKVAFHELPVRVILGNMKIDCLKVDKENITYDNLKGKLEKIGAINGQKNCIMDRNLSEYKYHFLVIHQGILDKVKKNDGNPEDFIKMIDHRWMVIDSGRGVPKELKDFGDARFVETSALLKMLEEYDKHGLVQTLFSLRRPLVNDKTKD